jgi:hypothetical protein
MRKNVKSDVTEYTSNYKFRYEDNVSVKSDLGYPQEHFGIYSW